MLLWCYNGGQYTTMLFLSRREWEIFTSIRRKLVVSKLGNVATTLHNLQTLHKDEKPRNIVYDERSGSADDFDFKRAEM